MREVSWRLDRIVNRRNQEFELDAKLHGKEIKTNRKRGRPQELNDSDQRAMDQALRQAMERKAEEYGKRC